MATLQPNPPADAVPVENRPGHHPAHEQDKPSGRDFVAKMHALATEDQYVAPSVEDDVYDLTQVEADHLHTGHVQDAPVPASPATSGLASHLGQLAGKPFAMAGVALGVAGTALGAAGSVAGAVRRRLPV